MTSTTLWVVDTTKPAILMHGDHPVCVQLDVNTTQALLAQQGLAYLYADKIFSEVLLPDGVTSLASLLELGIIKQSTQTYIYANDEYQLCNYRQLVGTLPTNLAHALSHAIQLMRWRDDHRFCSRCGTHTLIDRAEYASTCPTCQHRNYPRIQPCVITAVTQHCPITNKPQLLLALHHRHSESGMHGLIAGFVEIGESLETAVVRETLEETGITVHNIRYITSQPWPYPTNLMTGFVADYQAGELVADTSELVYAKFFDLDNLPKIPPQGTIARSLIEWVIKKYH